jgi:hypothetical protein
MLEASIENMARQKNYAKNDNSYVLSQGKSYVN